MVIAGRLRPLTAASAQRLSASRQESRTSDPATATQITTGCSTPFGIKARITDKHPRANVDQHVLNAFRHQGKNHVEARCGPTCSAKCSTPFGIKARITRKDAWFDLHHDVTCSTPFGIKARITSQRVPGRRPGRRCAQRLSASRQESRRRDRDRDRWQEVVLNAFRHQGKNHPAWTTSGIQISRAQRLSASRQESRERQQLARAGSRELCSTPFGIKARITSASFAAISTCSPKCSTPFGIKARITAPCTRSLARCPCSTPFGIKARITGLSLPQRLLGYRLCAQRLSASRQESQQLFGPRRPRYSVCSTPFGIKARITAWGVSRNDHLSKVLNAFRHQGKNHTSARASCCPLAQ